MTCPEVLERLPGFAAGEAGPEERRLLESHLGGCAGCAAEADRLAAIVEALRRDDVPDPGESYWTAYGGRLRQRIAGRERAGRAVRMRLLAAAAVLVLAAGLAFVIDRPWREPDAPAGPAAAAPSQPAIGTAIREPDLEAILARAAEGRDPESIDAVLDDVFAGDPWDPNGALGLLTSEERAALARSLAEAGGKT